MHKVVWNVGRTGHLVPFAMLEPVHVGGVTVSTATLHNEEDLARKDVRNGDEVVVMRAGDVIPQVVSPKLPRKNKSARKPKPPKKCPSCGTPTVKPEDSVFTICPNRTGCPGQNWQHVKHFVSKGAMDIEGLGEKQASVFLDQGLIVDVADIYDITEERLVEVDRFGETSAKNLVAAIDASRARPFKRVLYALGLPGVGFVTAEALADYFGSIDALHEADPEKIVEVDGVGPIMAEQIAESLSDDATWALVEKLREKGLRLEADESERRVEGGAAGRQDDRPHRHPADPHPRGGGVPGQSRRRQDRQLGLEKNRLRGGGGEPRLEADQSPGPRHDGPRRRRPEGPAGERPAAGARADAPEPAPRERPTRLSSWRPSRRSCPGSSAPFRCSRRCPSGSRRPSLCRRC